ncbi:MAG: histidine kinase [Eubacterium sp.]|nr:histidine kinase [Eubacterium sp.]
MSSWVVPFYFFILGAALLLTVMGLWFTAIMSVIDRWSKRLFVAYFSSMFVCEIVSLVDIMIVYSYRSINTLLMVMAFIETLFLSLPLPLLTAYIIHRRGDNLKKSKAFYTSLALWCIFVLLLSSTFFSKFVYSFTPDGEFLRGAGYTPMVIPLIAISAINFVATICSRKKLSRKYFISFIIASLPLTATLTIQAFIDIVPLVDISYVLSAVSMLGLIMSAQIEEHIRQQEEIANQRASVMVLQMRPHFIYNSMMTIYHLCKQDADKAQQVTLDFTNYLRKNFKAIASEDTIPFSAELEHTKTYLAVEQAQHEDMLALDYDVQFVNFRLPPLTLQPLVENAVKHGLNPNSDEPLRISVKTSLTENGVTITVEDTGAGFNPNDESIQPTALANISGRLEMMCNGTLKIESAEGKGTTVTIFVPIKK